MNARELEYFKNILLGKRKEVLAKEGVLESSGMNNSGNTDSGDLRYATHLADLGSDTMTLEHNSYFRARKSKYLQHVDAALQRIERSEYGICLLCGKEIPKERLQQVPHTRYCVPCKSQKDEEVPA